VSLVLLLGGARSGKSEMAEAMAAAESARLGAGVTYVAGSAVGRDDPDWSSRIEEHRRRRPPEWDTIESFDDLASVLGREELRGRVLLVDSLGSWLAGRDGFAWEMDLIDALCGRSLPTFVVSEEVGMGVHPSSAVGRAFRDALGRLNTDVAWVADAAYLVVAGRRLTLELP
jgi:adenosylcobinamide kinase/adenosylcobinamide-phosphate guanylyltransferase